MKNYLVIGLIFVLFIASGCVSNDTDTEQEEETIKIGVLVPLTGGLGTYGENMANGARLAVNEINKEGGISEKNVDLIVEDTETNPAKAAEAARKLIDVDQVQVIIGASGSSQTLAVAPIAEKSKVVLISPASTNAKITDAGEYIFRVIGSDNLQGEAIAKVAENKNYTKAATLVENNDYGIGLEEVFKKYFTGTADTSIRYDKGKADYRTELTTIKDAEPDVIMYVGYPAEASTILIQAKELGLDVEWISSEGIADPAMFENPAVGEQMEGMVLTKPGNPEIEKEAAYQDFLKNYKDAFGIDAGIFADTHYDATMLALLAMKEAGNDGTGIKDALPGISKEYKAITGDKTFDEFGDVPQDYIILSVQNQTMVTIGSWKPGSEVSLE